MKVDTYFSLKEHAYFILARKIAFNSRLRKQKDTQGSRNSRPSIARMFNRPRTSGANNNDLQDTERSKPTDREIETFRNNQKQTYQSKRHGSLQTNKPHNQETHRNFQNIGTSSQHNYNLNASMKSDGTEIFRQSNSSGYQNIIDLSRIGKRTSMKMSKAGEILLPSSLYKLHTCAHTYKQNANNTIF